MVKLSERAVPFMSDLKKRAAREYSLGYLTKEEFDTFCEYQDKLKKVVEASDKRHAKEESVNEN